MSSSNAPEIDVECVTARRQPVNMSFSKPVFAAHLNRAFPRLVKMLVDDRPPEYANRSEIS